MLRIKCTQQGIIMLEALLALVLFVMVAMALLNVSSQAINQRQQLMHTRCANWLAGNLLTVEFLSPPSKVMGRTTGEAQQCDLNWRWQLTRRAIGDKRFYLITLEIDSEEGLRQLERQTLRAW